MKIGIDARLALTNDRGHGKYLRGLINGLLEIDRQNEYLLYVDTRNRWECLALGRNAQLILLAPSNYIFWEQFIFPHRLYKDQVDVVLLSNHTAPLFCPVPSVVTVHDMLFLDALSLKQPLRQIAGRLYKRFCAPRSARYARKILTVSEYSRQQIINRLGVLAGKTTVTYESIEPLFHPETRDNALHVLRKYGLLPEEYILCLGASDPRKNTSGMLMAYRQLKSSSKSNVRLAIAGMSKLEGMRFLTDEPECRNMINEIVFLGFVTNEELAALYGQASVFVYPSLGEGFGLPILEAFACGAPVVASNVTSVPEIAGDAALVVNPASTDALAQAILRFLSDDRFRAEYKRRGLERVKQFSWQTVAGHTLSVFESVISGL